jgi:hypothetical protein
MQFDANRLFLVFARSLDRRHISGSLFFSLSSAAEC